jgi:hypothetical protein
MTKNDGWFLNQVPSDVLQALLEMGLELVNPYNHAVSAFSSSGDELHGIDSHEATRLLLEGKAGVSLWLSASENLFAWLHEDILCVSFRGFTEEEEANLVGRMKSRGLNPLVQHEEAPCPR